MDVFNPLNDRLLYELEQFLIRNGAAIYLHYFLRSIYPRITGGEIIIIMAPVDAAVIRLITRSGKTMDQISLLPEGRNMLENFLSSTHIQQISPVYTAINGTQLVTTEDLSNLRFIDHMKLGNLYIGIVDGIINIPGQLERLQQADPINILNPTRSGIIGDNIDTRLDDLPNPVVRLIALDLSLDDIVNNCRISIQFNFSICDNENFWNEKLRKDFSRQQVMINGSWKNTYRALNKKLYTFGTGQDGKLGHGNERNQFRPKLVEALDNVTHVACGSYHTAIISNNQLYTFGSGRYGLLGHGNEKDQYRPKLVEGLDNVTFVACSSLHTAVISNGRLYTFGYGESGELGHGDQQNQLRPKLVEGLNNVTMVACGSHTAAISNGQLYTFGLGKYGVLGHGDKQNQFTPKLVEGLDNVTFVACGGTHTAAISNGQLYTFGQGNDGALGHGYNTKNLSRPKLVEGFNNNTFRAERFDNVTFVAAGLGFTAAISNSRLYTFGGGHNGRLGHDVDEELRPKLVEGLNDVTYVACGDYYTGAVSAGRLYTFGSGLFGQLGQGDTKDRLKPTLVEGLTNVISVTCGRGHTATLAD